MAPFKSLDLYEVFTARLHDVQTTLGVFSTRSLRLTLKKVKRRERSEGLSLYTKTFPRLAKALDKALSAGIPLNSESLGFKPQANSELPIFMGELFNRILQPNGMVLPDPCPNCVRELRDILYLFYKYELPYSVAQEQKVIESFQSSENDLTACSNDLRLLAKDLERIATTRRVRRTKVRRPRLEVAREARLALHRLFGNFDPTDIVPSHGPGAVAEKQKLWDKFDWRRVSSQITNKYPFDAYFCASIGHVCDSFNTFSKVSEDGAPARVLLVPKDSRGPRLISCEPVDYQWIQQGLSRAIVQLVETSSQTKDYVFFTDQRPNQIAALYGSRNGRYATLDLKEASDRVSLELVRLLFPPHLVDALEACRSGETVLPSGQKLALQKFAPMGSALCFPIMALTIWAILSAGAPDVYTRERVHVYGDDVIVTTAYAEDAIEHLESFGLKINRDKSCTKGFFRESCGCDAFNGEVVTPTRIRTVWSSSHCPKSYVSWIAYARQFYNKKCFTTYELIVSRLLAIYKHIPTDDMNLSCPSLPEAPDQPRFKVRYNKHLQKRQFKVRVLKSPVITHEINGWQMLLRYFTEGCKATRLNQSRIFTDLVKSVPDNLRAQTEEALMSSFSVREYTSRSTSMLVHRWL